MEAAAWHKAVLANSPLAYKAFYDGHANSPYARAALKLQSQPKVVPLMQPTHLLVSQQLAPTLKASNATMLAATNIVPLPVGKAPTKPQQQFRSEAHNVLKLNSNPPQGNRLGRMSGNSNPRFAQSTGGGFGHRMH